MAVYPIIYSTLAAAQSTSQQTSRASLKSEEAVEALVIGRNSSLKGMLITGSADSTIRSWSLESGRCLNEFKGHEAAVTCLATAAGGKVLLSGSMDKTMRSWDICTAEALMIFYGHEATVLCIEVCSNKSL